ncbi:MAG: hypothetical protein VR70_05205 [Rhodospirillaceae bacterium BRH_c57]|nr:MAG: hypothetical protein VR70_05205 [Rhodospirillaceae bacterium BRH_c57]
MKRRPQDTFLMPDMASGLPPADAKNSSIHRPRIRRVVADHHPIELEDGDPALDDLLDLVGVDAMKEFGQFVSGGFRMVELIGLIDDAADQLPQRVVDALGLNVSVLPLVSTRIKLLTNALVAVALRRLGTTVHGPYEEQVFLKPTKGVAHQELGQKLNAITGVRTAFEDDLFWAEVPPIVFDIYDADQVWGEFMPRPSDIVDLFLHSY